MSYRLDRCFRRQFFSRLGEAFIAFQKCVEHEGNQGGNGFGLSVFGPIDRRVVAQFYAPVRVLDDFRFAVGLDASFYRQENI